jgi:hypothetical protein
MNATAELTATEIATRLLPLMKEYAEKMADLADRISTLLDKIHLSRGFPDPQAIEAGRLICLRDTLDKPVAELAQEASGLIEHAAIEHHLRGELKLRLDELEEHMRFSGTLIDELIGNLISYKALADRIRKLIEKSGRYKAPF